MTAANIQLYSANPAENALIEAVMLHYEGQPPRSLCVERDWDENDVQRGARPYNRVRCVEVYDGKAWADAGMPKDFSPFKCGIRMEAW